MGCSTCMPGGAWGTWGAPAGPPWGGPMPGWPGWTGGPCIPGGPGICCPGIASPGIACWPGSACGPGTACWTGTACWPGTACGPGITGWPGTTCWPGTCWPGTCWPMGACAVKLLPRVGRGRHAGGTLAGGGLAAPPLAGGRHRLLPGRLLLGAWLAGHSGCGAGLWHPRLHRYGPGGLGRLALRGHGLTGRHSGLAGGLGCHACRLLHARHDPAPAGCPRPGQAVRSGPALAAAPAVRMAPCRSGRRDWPAAGHRAGRSCPAAPCAGTPR
jgi:hypothetical protein